MVISQKPPDMGEGFELYSWILISFLWVKNNKSLFKQFTWCASSGLVWLSLDSAPFDWLDITRSSGEKKESEFHSVNISFKQKNLIWTYWGMEVTRALAISASAGRPFAMTTRPPAIKNTRHVSSTGFSISNRSCSSLPSCLVCQKTFKGVEEFAIRPSKKVAAYFPFSF